MQRRLRTLLLKTGRNDCARQLPSQGEKSAPAKPQLRAPSIVVKKLNALPVEAVVRGYVIGSGWKDYQKTGAIAGIKLPAGLKQAAKLPQTLFTPSTKAAIGEHDETISFETASQIVGTETAA